MPTVLLSYCRRETLCQNYTVAGLVQIGAHRTVYVYVWVIDVRFECILILDWVKEVKFRKWMFNY